MTEVKIVLIGHRGVGKSALLERLQKYFPQFQYYDLDAELSKRLANPIFKIFETFGEEYFRAKEVELANEILNKKNVIVSLGAGFNIETLPSETMCIWVRRSSDGDGRIFLNRPALNPKLAPLEDYLSRYEKRSKKYLEKADFIYDMPEGMSLVKAGNTNKNGIGLQEKNLFKEILFQTKKKRKGVLTLNALNVNTPLLFEIVELRTDLFSAKEIIRLVEIFKKKSKIILSFRKNNERDLEELKDLLSSFYAIDIDSELNKILDRIPGEIPQPLRKKIILSCHAPKVTENIKQLDYLTKTKLKSVVKCSPEINSFKELKLLYDWYLKNSSGRLIFPRSIEEDRSGRWRWFRQFMLSKQVFNFINDGFSAVQDQPTLIDTFLYSESFTHFSAVIGNPIHHSFSPVFHHEFMKDRKQPYYRIKIEENEFGFAMDFLEEIGMKLVSVTSPFKEAAYRKYKKRSTEDLKIKSVNTLYFSDNSKVNFTNTDTLGIVKTLKRISNDIVKKDLDGSTVVLWGGGGVVAAIKSVVPKVHLVASRDGKLPEGIKNIDILIWAAPRSLLTQFPKNCSIKSIFDLSYVENSMGLELAKEKNLPYVSGLEMFQEQGKGQQIFWSDLDERE